MSRHNFKKWWTSVSLPAQVKWLQSTFKIYIALLPQNCFLVLCNDAVPTATECYGKDIYVQKRGKYGGGPAAYKMKTHLNTTIIGWDRSSHNTNTKERCQLQQRNFHLLSCLLLLGTKNYCQNDESQCRRYKQVLSMTCKLLLENVLNIQIRAYYGMPTNSKESNVPTY